jgi:hypothetical protein
MTVSSTPGASVIGLRSSNGAVSCRMVFGLCSGETCLDADNGSGTVQSMWSDATTSIARLEVLAPARCQATGMTTAHIDVPGAVAAGPFTVSATGGALFTVSSMIAYGTGP